MTVQDLIELLEETILDAEVRVEGCDESWCTDADAIGIETVEGGAGMTVVYIRRAQGNRDEHDVVKAWAWAPGSVRFEEKK